MPTLRSPAADRLYRMKAEVLKALADPIRLAVIDFLQDGEQCVCDIAASVGAKRSNVSRHLGVLVKAGVIRHRKDGLKMMYALRCPCVLGFVKCVEGVLREKAREAAKTLRSMP